MSKLKSLMIVAVMALGMVMVASPKASASPIIVPPPPPTQPGCGTQRPPGSQPGDGTCPA